MGNNTQYIQSILAKRNKHITEVTAQTAVNKIIPVIRGWGGDYIHEIALSGSYAKGTAVQGGTDIDLFISVLSTTPNTLSEIYSRLYTALTQNGYYTARKQNVSIGLTVDGFKVDLVPAKRQSAYGSDHSLYKNKTNSWTKTNVKQHIDLVKGCGRLSEIRAMKIWRNNKNLDFPSFYLELSVIEALKYAPLLSNGGNLSDNIIKVLRYLETNFSTAKIVDPANSNNIISADMTQQSKNAIANTAARSLKGNWEEFIS
jgi:hypothetical protein